VAGVAGAVAWPRAALAQSDRMKRIGVLLLFAADDPEGQARVRAFEQELQRLGWRKGHNVQIEYRFAAGADGRMRAFTRELVDLPCDVIVTNSLSPVIAALREAPPIPIVFAMVTNPVEHGVIASLSHPDRDMTGIAGLDYPTIFGKWLELLKAIAPQVARVGIMFNPDAYHVYLPPPPGSYLLQQLEPAASLLGVEPIAVPVRDLGAMRDAIAALGRQGSAGLLVATDVFTVGHYPNIVSLALEHRLPGCYPYRYFATAGGLMSYGPNGVQVFRQAASYVDRILRGAQARDLPIQRPTSFELVINLKTANALGLTVPPLMLARADEVIE
jgi:putative tryptophan/tyrosine transport system substrate-binding protein